MELFSLPITIVEDVTYYPMCVFFGILFKTQATVGVQGSISTISSTTKISVSAFNLL